MRSRWVLLLTGVYGLALALVALWPTPVDRNVAVLKLPGVQRLSQLLGLDVHQAYELVERLSNVALFVPLGALVLLWRPRWSWWAATLIAFCVSGAIELAQAIARPERFATLDDVVVNTIGGAVGALLVVGGRALSRRPLRQSHRQRRH